MTVLDLRGRAGGDASGLAALAAALLRAAGVAERAAESARDLTGDGVAALAPSAPGAFAEDARAVGAALTTAAERLRELPPGAHAGADAVEATLAEELRRPVGTLAGALPAR